MLEMYDCFTRKGNRTYMFLDWILLEQNNSVSFNPVHDHVKIY